MSPDIPVDVDAVFNLLGRLGRWQVMQYAQLLHTCVICAIMVVAIVFIGYEPPYSCNLPASENNTEYRPQGECSLSDVETNQSVSCIYGYNYSIPKDRSIVTEWDLTCSNEYLTGLGQTFFVLGQAIGAYGFAFLADYIGRKKVSILSLWALLGTGIIIGVMPNIVSFLALRLVAGAVQQGASIVPFVLGMELFPGELRLPIAIGFGLTWGAGLTLAPGIAYFMDNYSWRHVEMVFAATGGFVLINTFTMTESPRWLLVNGRKDEAMEIFEKAAKVNGVSLEKIYREADGFKLTSFDEEQQDQHIDGDSATVRKDLISTRTGVDKASFVDLIKHPVTRTVFLVMLYIWAINSLTYYGLFLMSNRMSGNRYLNFFWNAVVEIPGQLVVLAALKRVGRKTLGIILHVLVAVFLLTAITLQQYSGGDPALITAVNVLSVVGKFCIGGSFMLIWIVTPELYPTNLRSLGLGCASFAARVGGMIAPFAGPLAKRVAWAPGLIFGIACLGAAGLFLLLPETSGKKLPQTLKDIDMWIEVDEQIHLSKKDSKCKAREEQIQHIMSSNVLD